jgi:hypothetical protein
MKRKARPTPPTHTRHKGAIRTLGVALILTFALLTTGCAGAGGGPSAAQRGTTMQRAGGGEVALMPIMLGAGEGGWCLTTVAASGSGCPTYALAAREGPFLGPIIVEDWTGASNSQGSHSSSADVGVDEALVLTTSEVTAVALAGGVPIATHADPALPPGFRGADLELLGRGAESSLGISAPPRLPRPQLAPIGANGKASTQHSTPGAPLDFEWPARSWGRGPAATGVCGLEAKGLAGLTSGGGSVIPAVRPHADVRGREFVDCEHVTYQLNHWPIEANVLLDAARPGTAPAPLPAMHRLVRHPGISVTPGPGGELLARRASAAWLVVAGGRSLEQRVALLEHLSATLHL